MAYFYDDDNASNDFKYQSLEETNKLFQEEQVNHLIDKYLDIDVDDDILIISPTCENKQDYNFSFQNLPKLIHEKFCLLKPIDSCEVKIKPHTPQQFFFSRIPIEEMFEFSFSAHPSKRYNKIVVKNCLQFFDKHQKYFCDFLNTLLKNTTPYVPCILIIQRVNNLSTLPFYKQVYDEWAKVDTEYLKFISAMKNHCFSIRFNIETIKCYMNCKSQWYSKLKEKSIYPLNERSIVSNVCESSHLANGIRELNEGLFKYQEDGSHLEISDRVLFIGGTSIKNQLTVDDLTRYKQKPPCRYDPKEEIEINEKIMNIRVEITPDFTKRSKKVNSYLAKPIPKPKSNWFD